MRSDTAMVMQHALSGPGLGGMILGMAVSWQMHYDRRVSTAFLRHFQPDGAARILVEYARYAPYPVDFQLRHDAKTGAEHASLYVGLTAVINVRQTKTGALKLWADEHWANSKHHFSPAWRDAVARSDWLAVEQYLETVIPSATKSHASQEGLVQSAVSVFSSHERVMLDREAVLHFRDQQQKRAVMGEVAAPIVEALKDVTGVPGLVKTSYGGKCDVLAIDRRGRLLAVEVKPKGVSSIMWAAAQATVYAWLFERWLRSTDLPQDAQPLDVLRGMAHQRALLGLAEPVAERLPSIPPVVPVVAVQRGAAAAHLDGLRKVQAHLMAKNVGHPDLELCEVNMAGRLHRLDI
jgi:hypothetical protein